MNAPWVLDAIVSRLQDDTSLYANGEWAAIIRGGIHSVIGPPAESTVYPYAVLDVEMVGNPNMAFLAESYDWQAVLRIYDIRANGITNIRAVTNRVFGNAMAVATGIPAHGLHRHTLTLNSNGTINPLGYVADGGCICNGSSLSPAQGSTEILEGSMTFTGTVGAPKSA
jgi:hypothetical protein